MTEPNPSSLSDLEPPAFSCEFNSPIITVRADELTITATSHFSEPESQGEISKVDVNGISIEDQYSMRGDLAQGHVIASVTMPFVQVMKFNSEVLDDGSTTVSGPSNIVLNQIRTELVKTGIHTGEFVDHDGDFVSDLENVHYLAQRRIPQATKMPHITHDNLFHRLSLAVMCEAIFDRVVEGARAADAAQDPDLAERVGLAFDIMGSVSTLQISSEENLENASKFLAELYSTFMPSSIAGIRALSDMRHQLETNRALTDFVVTK